MAAAAVLVASGIAVVPRLAASHPSAAPAHESRTVRTPSAAQSLIDGLPVHFEENDGQHDPTVRFSARVGDYTLFLTPEESVFVPVAPQEAAPAPVRMSLTGGNAGATPVGDDRLATVTNYFRGNDPKAWVTNVPNFGQVRYQGVYPGIDMVYRTGGPGKGVEYDFQVAPGADPGAIALRFTDAASVRLDDSGDLVVTGSGGGDLRQHRPVLYQEIGGQRVPVEGAFTSHEDGTVGFTVGEHDADAPLVIDPSILYSSFLGGTTGNSTATGVAADASGNVYVTGSTNATDFPNRSAAQATNHGGNDIFVVKINTNSSGDSSLVYATYLGGNRDDLASGGGRAAIAVDGSGQAYVTSATVSGDYPTTGSAFDTSCGDSGTTCNGTDNAYADGASTAASTTYTSATATFHASDIGLSITGTNIPAGTTIAAVPNATTLTLSTAATATGTGLNFTIVRRDRHSDSVLSKLSAAGSTLSYSTFVGGKDDDYGTAIAVDASGNAFITGVTRSSNFPLSATPYDTTCGATANADCNAVDDSNTATTTAGSATVVLDGGVLTANAVGKAISGTNIPPGATIATVVNETTITMSVAASVSGPTSYTITRVLPRKESFVTKVNTAASGAASLVYSTYLGGSTSDEAGGIAVDASSRAYVVGMTASTDYPTVGAFQGTNGGGTDGFLAKLDPAVSGSGALVYSTFIGGSAGDSLAAVTVDGSSNAYVAGGTSSTNFPVASAFQSTLSGASDAAVAKFNTATTGAASRVYSTYLGGSGYDGANGIAIDNAAPPTVTVGGFTGGSTDFPQLRPIQASSGGGFLTRLSSAGSALVYSTYTVDSPAAVAVAGASNSTYIVGAGTPGTPVTTNAYQQTFPAGGAAFVTKIDPVNDAPIVTQISQRGGPVVGGTPVTISGSGFVGVTSVKFGAVAVSSFTVNGSNTQITTTSPLCSGCGVLNVTVTNGAGTSASTAANRFVYGDGIFTPTGACVSFCTDGRMVKLQSGKVLYVDRGNGAGTTSALYDPLTGSWAASGPCPANCGMPGASITLLNSGKVLVAGGINNAGTPTGSAYLFDPAGAGTWAATGSIATARAYHTATVLPSGPNAGKVLIAGGCNFLCLGGNDAGMSSAALYDPVAGTFTNLGGSLKTGRFGHTATALSGPACSGATPPAYCGQVLLAGGMSNNAALTAAELYDPLAVQNNKMFNTTGSLATGRMEHIGLTLAGPACSGGTPPAYCGKVMVAGGGGYTGPSTATAELYDPATATWSATGSMANPRTDHAGTMLTNGMILVTGSSTASTNADIAERYDPAAGTWGLATGMWSFTNFGRCCAALLDSGPASACGANCGKVLVLEAGASPRAELYTPLPKVTSVTPNNASGAVMTTVTVTGTGLTAVTAANFGTFGAVSVTHDATNPDTTMQAVTTGAVSAGAVDITASSPGGKSLTSSGDQFTYAAWGLLRATTSPALASQISVDGSYTTNWADTYGTTFMKAPVGSHTVCFRDKEGFTTPACQNATIVANQTTSPAGNFVPRGFLHVSLSPAVAGTISVDGVRTDDFGVFTDFPTGSHQVCFGAVADWLPPTCQNVTVNAGATTDVTGTYTSSPGAPGETNKGLLRVTTSPSVASQVLINGNIADTYGTTFLKLDPGTYSICFRDVEGFVTPACQNATVLAGQTTSPVGTFVPRGYLHVVTSPAVAATIFVDGVARDDFGLFTDAPTGSHQVCFGPGPGFSNVPACQSVTVNAGATTDVTGTYS